MILFAENNPQLTLLVTPIGTGIAGMSVEEVAGCFAEYFIPDNVILPRSFVECKHVAALDAFIEKHGFAE